MKLAAIALAVVAGCDHCTDSAPIESCQQNLGGVFIADGKRWMIVDSGATLEAYPLFPDLPVVPEIEVAPRVIDLFREDTGISGRVRRRYMQRTASCLASIPAQITVCADDALDLLLADPVPPLQFEGPFTVGLEPSDTPGTRSVQLFEIYFTRPLCVFPRPDSNHRERWHRE